MAGWVNIAMLNMCMSVIQGAGLPCLKLTGFVECTVQPKDCQSLHYSISAIYTTAHKANEC